ncbi:unnamed protein product [Brugia timori]|uniref:Uncharacterized protein n=1 Tax=Brugia timori TaxID=42155 RepID=A0A3P7WL04_9BILA|nr:unnamed protein product [Brugia timori]
MWNHSFDELSVIFLSTSDLETKGRFQRNSLFLPVANYFWQFADELFDRMFLQ